MTDAHFFSQRYFKLDRVATKRPPLMCKHTTIKPVLYDLRNYRSGH